VPCGSTSLLSPKSVFNIAPTIYSSVPSSAAILGDIIKPKFTKIESSTRLAEGGGAPESHQLADYEEFELTKYIGLQICK
jgi:hypothetical protein